jgi:aspartate/methionine/tyrosine aminotransferase
MSGQSRIVSRLLPVHFVDIKEHCRHADKSSANSPGTRIHEVLGLQCGTHVSFKPPEFLVQAAKDALDDVAANQYSHTRGRPRLRKALSEAYSPYFGKKIDPETVLACRSRAEV